MNLYKISQDVNIDYDTYDSAVVRAPSEEAAKSIHPGENDWLDSWTTPDKVRVELLAENVSGEQEVIVASFNAG